MTSKDTTEDISKEKKLEKSLKSDITIVSKVKKGLKLKDDKSQNQQISPASSLIEYGTGRRKNSVARVWVKIGKGQVTVNKKALNKYFPIEAHRVAIQKPFEVTNTLGQYDIICTTKGGGCSGQAGAIMHGVARALDKLVPDFHKILRDHGLLTRDSRIVERKKYGRSGARKRYQFSKR